MVVLITFTLLRDTLIFYSESWTCLASINKPFAAFLIWSNKCMSSLWEIQNFHWNSDSVYFNAYLAWYVTKFQPHRVLVHFFRSLNAREKLSSDLSRLDTCSRVSGGRISQLNDELVRKRFAAIILFIWRDGRTSDAATHVHHIADDNRAERRRRWQKAWCCVDAYSG